MDITGIHYGNHVYRQIVNDVLSPDWMAGERIPASRIMDAVARAMEVAAYSNDLVGSAANRLPVGKESCQRSDRS
jgi:hypothetical protein